MKNLWGRSWWLELYLRFIGGFEPRSKVLHLTIDCGSNLVGGWMGRHGSIGKELRYTTGAACREKHIPQ